MTPLLGGLVKRHLVWLGIAALALGAGIMAQGSAAQNGTKKPAAKAGGSAPAIAHGKDVFQKKCAVCHYATSDAKKIGPGLQGLNKRGTFSGKGGKVTDESVKAWIENGSSLMPPFKEVLTAEELQDLVRYVRTL